MALPEAADGRTCLITGASAGIGVEIARELARRGRGVTLVARREDRLRELAGSLQAAHGIRADVLAADLTDRGDRAGLPAEIDKRGLTVDVLVNNAGIGTFGPVYAGDADREVAMLRTNVEALAHLCNLFLPGMVERGRGAVLNVASTAAFQPLPGQSGYAGSKAFVLSYSRGLRAELRGKGVTVTALCPGPVETEFGRAAGLADDQAVQALPRFMWRSSETVARLGVQGLAKGRPVVIPGWPNKTTAFFGRHLPDGLTARIVARRHPAMS